MIKKNKAWILMILSVIVLASTIFQRVTVESNNKTIDVVLDYVEMKDMAEQSDHDLGWWFRKFSNFGIQYVGLHEATIESMINEGKNIEVIMGWEVLQSKAVRETYFNNLEKDLEEYEIDEYDILVSTQSKEIHDFIYEGLESRYDEGLFAVVPNGEDYTILLDGNINDVIYRQNQSLIDANGKGVAMKQKPYSSKLIKLGLGFQPEKIELIKESGLQVMPRPSNYSPWTTDQYIEALFSDFESFDMIPPTLIFNGDAILGYPDYNYMVAEYMQDKDIKVGLVETGVQRGNMEQTLLDELSRGLEYNAVRIFSIPEYIQERFKFYNYEGAEEIENTLYRAVIERNIRMIYFRPFKESKVSYVTDFEEYEKMFQRFEDRIEAHNMNIGRSSVFEPNRVRLAKQTLMGWGIVAGATLLLSCLFSMSTKSKDILLVLGMLAVPAGYVVASSLMEKMMALAASIIFPSLAMVWVCRECKKYFDSRTEEKTLLKTILMAAKNLAIATGISTIGGLFVAGILSNTDFLLEMDIFRGVKISQMLPMAIYVVIYLAYFGYKRKDESKQSPSLRFEDIKTFLLEDIKIIYVLLSVIILVVGYIYIARTGHETNIQPSAIEMIARNMLEERLLARPRTKEFLIGFPALMVAIYFARNKYKLFTFGAGLVAVIGQASIANTFSHLRTPVYLSAARTVYGLGLGIILGAIYILLIELAFKGFRLLWIGAQKGRN